MTQANVETTYEAVAKDMDTVGAQHSELFLAKPALLLGREINGVERVLTLIDSAKQHLETST